MKYSVYIIFALTLFSSYCTQGSPFIEPEFYNISIDVYVDAHYGKGYNWNGSYVYSKLIPSPFLANDNPDDATNGYKGYKAWDGTRNEIASDYIIAGLSPSAEITSIVQFKDIPPGTYEIHSFVDLVSQRIHRDHDPAAWSPSTGEDACYTHSQNSFLDIDGDGTSTMFAVGAPSTTGTTLSPMVQFTSADSGSTWSAPTAVNLIASTDKQVTLYDIERIAGPPDTYYAVGEGARIFKSTDGGSTWTKQTNFLYDGNTVEYLRPLYAIDCLNANQCIASGYNGAILTTNDGGTTWTIYDNESTGTLTTGTTKKLVGIAIANATCPVTTATGTLCAWAVGDLGNIIMVDLDANMVPQKFSLQYAKDNANAFITRDYSDIVITQTGATWVAWAVGEYDSDTSTAILVRWDDTVDEWKRQQSVAGIPTVSIYNVGFDGTNLWLTGSDHAFYRSSGTSLTSSWTKLAVESTNPQALLGMEVIDSNNVYAVGTRGVVWRTANAGSSASYLLDRRTTSYLTPVAEHADTDTNPTDGLDNNKMFAVAPHPDHDTESDGYCTVHGVPVGPNHPIDHDKLNQNNDGFCTVHGGMEAIKVADASRNGISYLAPDPADPKYSLRNIVVNKENEITIRNLQFRLGSKTNNNFWPYDDAGWDAVLIDSADNDDGWDEWY